MNERDSQGSPLGGRREIETGRRPLERDQWAEVTPASQTTVAIAPR